MQILTLITVIGVIICIWVAIAYGVGAKRFSYRPLLLISIGYLLLSIGGLLRLEGSTILGGLPIAFGAIIIARFYTEHSNVKGMEDRKIRHKDLLLFVAPKT